MSNQEDLATGAPETAVRYVPGTFCWWELGTGDRNASGKFYSDLFGWSTVDVPMGPELTYTLFRMDDRDIAGLYPMGPDTPPNMAPPGWLCYVATASADETARRAVAAGGKVIMEPTDAGDIGRMAELQDPTGAFLGVWEPRNPNGAGEMPVLGSVCWNELAAKDSAAAAKFYSEVFDWDLDMQDMGVTIYTMFKIGGNNAGGMMQMAPDCRSILSHWMLYFAVADCDALAAKARELGATVLNPPTDIPNVGRFALIRDPQGADFSIIKLEGT